MKIKGGTPVYDINRNVIYGLTIPTTNDKPSLQIHFNLISDVFDDINYYLSAHPTGMEEVKVHIQPFALSIKQIFNLKMSIRIVLCTY